MREGEGKGFARPMSNYFLYVPVSDCIRRSITIIIIIITIIIGYSYAYVPVGTVIFDTNNHEIN